MERISVKAINALQAFALEQTKLMLTDNGSHFQQTLWYAVW
jgi:hypothetical protein